MTVGEPGKKQDYGFRKVAYFSMEIGIENAMPTYSGGLGVLAGDTIHAAADLEIPLVGVSLLHRRGYFLQSIDAEGWQHEADVDWNVGQFCALLETRVEVEISGRPVRLQAWRYDAVGATGFVIPVFFLDADVEGNAPEDRRLTDHLYGGDHDYRLKQEALLGIGGVRLLRALGMPTMTCYHMNEGHAAFLSLELLREICGNGHISQDAIKQVRGECIFTTHTPVPAGHDKFPLDRVRDVLGEQPFIKQYPDLCCEGETLNMTHLALSLSHYVNGVAKRHGEVSRAMFPAYNVDHITNGVHCSKWASDPMAALFDRFVPDWRVDNLALRNAMKIPLDQLSAAHKQAKQALLDLIKRQTGKTMKPGVLTIGFARRAAMYKRADLLFHDIKRLKEIAQKHGGLQLIFAGKAHPADGGGKALIHRVIELGGVLQGPIDFVYLSGYDMSMGRLVCSGVDVWLNNPEPPLEASGTSGMKAALNGVPNLSVLDGWWVEGHIEGVTGWAIETPRHVKDQRASDAAHLYDKLEKVAACYNKQPQKFLEIMRHAIALNASFFNTQRMMRQYVIRAYFRSVEARLNRLTV